jgi:hypothetical protein
MTSVQPINLWRYIGIKLNRIPNYLRRLFYLSFEDALWDLLTKKEIKKGSTILIPDFYCGDVEKNIISNGYKTVKYSVLNNLRVDKNIFLNCVHQYKPSVIIVFHPVGIKSNLFDDTKWIKKLDDKIILIEDNVHRITNPKKIKIVRRNHFVIDSLRKVVPLQGSNIFGLREDVNYNEPSYYQSLKYSLEVHFYWLVMIIFWNLGFYTMAEKHMKIGYDLIGDEKNPARGFFYLKYFFNYINYQNIYRIKEKQIRIYKKYVNTDAIFNKSDWKNMKGYPIILDVLIANKILDFLRKNKLMVRFELNDSEWSKRQKIIYLPLGPHIKDAEIIEICKLVLKSLDRMNASKVDH